VDLITNINQSTDQLLESDESSSTFATGSMPISEAQVHIYLAQETENDGGFVELSDLNSKK